MPGPMTNAYQQAYLASVPLLGAAAGFVGAKDVEEKAAPKNLGKVILIGGVAIPLATIAAYLVTNKKLPIGQPDFVKRMIGGAVLGSSGGAASYGIGALAEHWINKHKEYEKNKSILPV